MRNLFFSLKIARAHENRPVRFSFAGKMYLTCFQLDGFAVGPEYFQLVFVVSPKVIVDGLSAGRTPYAPFSVVPSEGDFGQNRTTPPACEYQTYLS